jgi:hypothetical protein
MHSHEWEYIIQNDVWEVECECVMAIEVVWGVSKGRLCKRDNFSLVSLHLEQK